MIPKWMISLMTAMLKLIYQQKFVTFLAMTEGNLEMR